MNATGKAARRRHGTRAAAKKSKGLARGKRRGKKHRKQFGSLPVSALKGNAGAFVARASQFEHRTSQVRTGDTHSSDVDPGDYQ